MAKELTIYSIAIGIAIVLLIVVTIAILVLRPKRKDNQIYESESNASNESKKIRKSEQKDKMNGQSDQEYKTYDEQNKYSTDSYEDQNQDNDDTGSSGGSGPKGDNGGKGAPIPVANSNEDFNTECLRAHNDKRRKHRVPDLLIDNSLINYAKKRALTLKNTNIFAHEPNPPFGENLHYVSPYSSYACTRIVEAWYKEIKDYDFNAPQSSKGMIGHFTQVVWKSSQKVGCAQAFSAGSRKLYSVCEYDPPGNYQGEEVTNVPRPIS